MVSLLLSKSTTQLHVKDKRGRTGLHLGAANGHLDMVSLLLGQGADIDVYDKSGMTPLHFSSKAGHLSVVKLLVESGANPRHETKDGRIPICFAAAASHAEVISYLMKRDHDTHVLMEDKKVIAMTVPPPFLRPHRKIYLTDGFTKAMVSCKGDIDMVNYVH